MQHQSSEAPATLVRRAFVLFPTSTPVSSPLLQPSHEPRPSSHLTNLPTPTDFILSRFYLCGVGIRSFSSSVDRLASCHCDCREITVQLAASLVQSSLSVGSSFSFPLPFRSPRFDLGTSSGVRSLITTNLNTHLCLSVVLDPFAHDILPVAESSISSPPFIQPSSVSTCSRIDMRSRYPPPPSPTCR